MPANRAEIRQRSSWSAAHAHCRTLRRHRHRLRAGWPERRYPTFSDAYKIAALDAANRLADLHVRVAA
jgi:hypothetical protein